MGDRRRHQDRDRRRERHFRSFECQLAGAAFDQENLKQISMPVRANGPIVNRGARGDGLDMNKIECLIVRRIPVEMEQR